MLLPVSSTRCVLPLRTETAAFDARATAPDKSVCRIASDKIPVSPDEKNKSCAISRNTISRTAGTLRNPVFPSPLLGAWSRTFFLSSHHVSQSARPTSTRKAARQLPQTILEYRQSNGRPQVPDYACCREFFAHRSQTVRGTGPALLLNSRLYERSLPEKRRNHPETSSEAAGG